MAAYIGVSYYKLNASSDISFEFYFSNTVKKSIQKLYIEGLGEFFIRNNLRYPPNTSFHYEQTDPHDSGVSNTSTIPTDHATLAFGGGKDSHVAMALLDELNIAYELVSVVLAENVQNVLRRLSHKNITFIERKIDSRLIELGKEGTGYNGHVPITAINSIILSLYSYLIGNNWVIFSNERGASVPTMHHGNHEVNHQYSKSIEFEKLFKATLDSIFTGKIEYFSLLRPFSELWIAKTLAEKAIDAQACFSSCNRNFVFEGDNKLEEGKRWCGECSKCVYTAIITAPHISKEKFIAIFDRNILNMKKNLQVAKDLCGIGNSKPWECVGDFADTAACLMILSNQQDWQDAFVPQQLQQDLDDKYGSDFLLKRFETEIKSRTEHFLPHKIKTLVS